MKVVILKTLHMVGKLGRWYIYVVSNSEFPSIQSSFWPEVLHRKIV